MGKPPFLVKQALLALALVEGAEDLQADEAGQPRQPGIDHRLRPVERHRRRPGDGDGPGGTGVGGIGSSAAVGPGRGSAVGPGSGRSGSGPGSGPATLRRNNCSRCPAVRRRERASIRRGPPPRARSGRRRRSRCAAVHRLHHRNAVARREFAGPGGVGDAQTRTAAGACRRRSQGGPRASHPLRDRC